MCDELALVIQCHFIPIIHMTTGVLPHSNPKGICDHPYLTDEKSKAERSKSLFIATQLLSSKSKA